MKKPRRNKFEQIEDAFFDLEIDEQERMLNTLNSLFRMKCRLAETARESLDRAEHPKTDAVASAADGPQSQESYSINMPSFVWARCGFKMGGEMCGLVQGHGGSHQLPDPQGSLLDDPAAESDDGGSLIDASTLEKEPGTNKIRIPKP